MSRNARATCPHRSGTRSRRRTSSYTPATGWNPSLLDELEARAARLIACWGNNDGSALRQRLPERADATLAGVRFTVVHETGAAAGREGRMSRLYPDSDVLVFGHSHIPWDTTTSTGLRLLNPGSPTDRRRQPFCTYMTAGVDDGALKDVVLHRLSKSS